MRIAICSMGLLLTTLLIGCGQTGNLQLPNDPNYDKRAQYLLYKDGEKSVNVKHSDASDATEKAALENQNLDQVDPAITDKPDADKQSVEK